MRQFVSLLFLFAFLSSFVFAQDTFRDEAKEQTGLIIPIQVGEQQYEGPAAVLYDNGPLVTHPGGGFGGADASVLESVLGLTIYGFGNQVSANNSDADDFTVPSPGWNVQTLTTFAYQTGSTTTSTITEVRARIWDGDPTAGGNIIWGDLTTNIMSSTTWSNIYRSIDTDPLASNRPIMVQTSNIGATLNPGTYWIEWITNGSLSSGPWAPPISIIGQTTTGNGKQNQAGTWVDLISGSWPQGLPFILEGDVLPVELTSFTATANQNEVVLNWITASETNNQGFSVERSSGGEYQAIGFVQGHGTTTETQVYAFTDRNVNVGSYTYRLKQIDFDGSFEYSSVVEADVVAPNQYVLGQNYPNPFNPSTKIDYSLAADSKVKISVYNLLGESVATLVNSTMPAGTHEVNFDASGLNSGIYFYRIDANGVDGSGFSQVRKMMLTK